MAKPTIVFVPGLWEGPQVYSSIASTLASPPHNYPTASVMLPSTGKVSPDNETLQGDVQGIRSQIAPLIEAGREIILVMHSAGGFLGSNAIEGWSVEKRKAEGRQGGVRRLVFLAAGLAPEETMHVDLPFMEKDGAGCMTCANPRQSLFSDLPDSVAAEWIPKLQCQPAEGWNDVITYAAWKEIPSIYLVAEHDKVLPPPVQQQCAAIAGSEVVRAKGGHMLMLSLPDKCVEVILRAAEG